MNKTEIILQLDNVSKVFGGLCALDKINFSLVNGEILGLIGPNGAGKTTLFNIIAGLYKPTSGQVIFRGNRISGLPSYKVCWKGIARTFQQPQPFKGLSVFQNIMVGKIFAGEKRGLTKDIREILDLVGLSDKSEVLVDNLTAHDLKKVEIAKALATNPEILLLDEVVCGLNQVEQESIKKLILNINKNNINIMMIEHVMETVMNTADRIVVINNGKVLRIGSPPEIAKDSSVIEAYLGKEFLTRVKY